MIGKWERSPGAYSANIEKQTNSGRTEMENIIEINGVRYVPASSSDYKIIRSRDAGVFAGYVESRSGDSVTLTSARRIWYWDGAATLSELSQHGTSNPGSCKFPAVVPRVEVIGVCEILDTTDKARASIESVPVWSKQ